MIFEVIPVEEAARMKPEELPNVSEAKRQQRGLLRTAEHLSESRLSGGVIIGELIRNMELGRFEMAFTVLMPCAFTVYLNPEDHAMLSGVFDLVVEDARRALCARVAELNASRSVLGIRRHNKARKEHKIACRDWMIEFLPDTEVPVGDVEIHSELNETAQPGFRGMKTTLTDREPSAAVHRTTGQRNETRRPAEALYAEIRYEDDSGPQLYLVTQNQVRVGRGGDEQPMDLALYTSDEVSREHLLIRRDAATGVFFVTDVSTNGTWLDGKRLRKGVEELLPNRAEIGVGEVLTLAFEARR
ncbi:MAG TPA: FHA domain-containing protein [Bryobacteraceae bacterium]|nr:FHA domain-containing protein [Bryobacteraceae bacterium]